MQFKHTLPKQMAHLYADATFVPALTACLMNAAVTGASVNVYVSHQGCVTADAPVKTKGTDRAHVHFIGETGRVNLRHDIPFELLAREPQKYCLYNIRFSIPDTETRIDENAFAPLSTGYFGITKRGFMQRFAEHEAKARKGEGNLLHAVWAGLLHNYINFYPVVQLSGSAATLKEIYALEEKAVAQQTLTPAGLNAIPGGEAGIKMLHELALLKGRKVGVDERDAAVERLQQESPCAHYRRGHMRKLPTEKLTYVKPCWVNLK